MVAIFQHIPEIMGLDLTLRNGAWEGRYYINKERHLYKRDKLKVKLWKRSNGNSDVIYVHEQGGQSLSLQSWLIQYGNAADYPSAMRIMEGKEPINVDILNFDKGIRHSIATKALYVTAEEHARFEQFDLNKCALFCFMCRLFGEQRVREVWKRYGVTTNERGDAVFWYYNPEGNICHDKIMRYGMDGHRDKSFGGSRRFKTADGYLERCMFGSNLIQSDGACCCVESEKTCLLAALAYPESTWVASGGITQLRDVDARMALYPDIDGIEKWSAIEGANIVEWWNDASVEGCTLGDHSDLGDLIVQQRKRKIVEGCADDQLGRMLPMK
jgi:hypothetical protein